MSRVNYKSPDPSGSTLQCVSGPELAPSPAPGSLSGRQTLGPFGAESAFCNKLSKWTVHIQDWGALTWDTLVLIWCPWGVLLRAQNQAVVPQGGSQDIQWETLSCGLRGPTWWSPGSASFFTCPSPPTVCLPHQWTFFRSSSVLCFSHDIPFFHLSLYLLRPLYQTP